IAAAMVVLFHYSTRFPLEFPQSPSLPFRFAAGATGVNLFFAISGFVILMTLDRTVAAWDFVRARFLRLYPAYWVAVLATATICLASRSAHLQLSISQVLINLTMMQSWLHVPAVDGVYWSLVVEVSFYAVMLLLWRVGALRHLPWIILGWLALHIMWGVRPGLSWTIGAVLIVTYIPYFAIGMAFYMLRSGQIGGRMAAFLLASALGAAALGAGAGHFMHDVLTTLGCIAIFFAMQRGWLRWLNQPWLLWLGAISYPLYLVHQNIGFVVMDHLTHAGVPVVAAALAALVLALALAQGITHWVERPALRWGKRA
ncbi:MAG: acyltransferase family protein, partial [Sphingopyxis sp.]